MKNLNKFIPALVLIVSMTMLSASIYAISVNANSRGSLPSVLYESSAVDYTGGTHFWSLNDSGSPNEIYRIANDGSLTKTITVLNATNWDWEEMTHDAARNYMYIGDFGNNLCDRTNLRIYRIPYPSTVAGTTVNAEQISFSYPDQTSFPSHWMNFDAEAFFHFQGKLYIFTKTDGSAVGYTKMYSVPDVAGSYIATLVDSFYTNDRTTSAAISPDQSSVILISNTHIHLFRNFTGDNFFGGQHTQINIAGSWTQKEGVSFSSNNEIYMTDENNGSGNHLYYVDMSQWIPAYSGTTSIEKISNEASADVFPNPANEFLNVQIRNTNSQNVNFMLFDLTGKKVYETKIENTIERQIIRTADFPPGVYFYKIYADAMEIQTSRLVLTH